MKYFKDNNGGLYAYESDGSQDDLFRNKVQITEEQFKNTTKESYVSKRVSEYPSIGDQLDALYKAGLFPEEMANKIKSVKDKYPK